MYYNICNNLLSIIYSNIHQEIYLFFFFFKYKKHSLDEFSKLAEDI